MHDAKSRIIAAGVSICFAALSFATKISATEQKDQDGIPVPYSAGLLLAISGMARRSHRTTKGQYIMTVGDKLNLSEMAEELYCDARLSDLIVELNRSVVRERFVANKRIVEINRNQQLLLPTPEQISSFQRSTIASSHELITVVQEPRAPRVMLEQNLRALVATSA